jgi:hypothetical protein
LTEMELNCYCIYKYISIREWQGMGETTFTR